MLVAVVSDSHNNSEAVDLAKKAISKCDVLLFLGDGEGDLDNLTEGFKGEVYAVCGNCDFKMINPVERIVILNDKKIYMTHGNKYNVNFGFNSIYYRGREVDADIVLYGHTHIPVIKHEGDMIIMNPGSVSSGRGVKFRMSIGYLKIVKNQPVEAFIEELK